MSETIPRFEALVRRATGRRGMAPLLRALGFEPRLAAVPGEAWPTYGLAEAPELAGLVLAGERGGLAALLLELGAGAPADGGVGLARRIRAHNPARPYLFLLAGPGYRRLVVAAFGLEGELRQLVVDRRTPRRTDLETLEELAARPGEGGLALALRHARALDRSRVTRRFFRDFRAQRDRVAAAWRGIGEECRAERDQLALLLLCRLMFLYFLQRRGHLAGDPEYVHGLFRAWRREPGEGGFLRSVLGPLFFGALNTRPERRTAAARALGPLPYLNGGLFERDALERRFPALELEDDVVAAVFDRLFERYRFTTVEAADAAADAAGEVAVDPEMLGRVFEELMAADRRGSSGTYFTPAPVVDRLVRLALEAWIGGRTGLPAEAVERLVRECDAASLAPDRRAAVATALAGVRLLDPACGSGAFLLGALSRLARLRAAVDDAPPGAVRRALVARSLHGVDIQDDAALLCALRLWLALTLDGGPAADGAAGASADRARAPGASARVGSPGAPTAVAPLPNLDRRVRQGDALLDPIDLIAGDDAASPRVSPGADAAVRRSLRAIGPLAAAYLSADPERKPALLGALAGAEAALARAWLDAIERRLLHRRAELRTRAGARDLFGERPADAAGAAVALRALEARLDELRRLRAALDEKGALPFFSFDVHFAEATERGFDLLLSNPPWVRAHRWPAPLRRLVRRRYAVCRQAGWRRGAELAGAPAAAAAQVDLALLFLERSIRLLAPAGVLAMLLPAKSLRSLYGAGGRRLLLRETRVAYLEDHSLDQRSIFRADAFTAAVVARKHDGAGRAADCGGEHGPTCVRVTMVRRDAEPLRFAVAQSDLPVLPGDLDAPWLIAPPAVRSAFRRMQAAGPPLGEWAHLRVRRGVVTGANDVLIAREAEPKLGDLAWIRAEGFFRARRDGRPAAAARRFHALVEGGALRPLVRGADIEAWRYRTASQVVWVHDDATAEPRPAPPRLARYLDRHAATLRARSGWRPGMADGALFRLSRDTLGHRVAWHDLTDNLKAVALPAGVRGLTGRIVPVIPLNTVYFVPTRTEDEAMLLAALLNSLPVRTFARAVAERAKDARFRFLGWTMALLPLPDHWDRGITAVQLTRISREAHRRGGIAAGDQAELDTLVAAAYGLGDDDRAALASFDCWLRGAA